MGVQIRRNVSKDVADVTSSGRLFQILGYAAVANKRSPANFERSNEGKKCEYYYQIFTVYINAGELTGWRVNLLCRSVVSLLCRPINGDAHTLCRIRLKSIEARLSLIDKKYWHIR